LQSLKKKNMPPGITCS